MDLPNERFYSLETGALEWQPVRAPGIKVKMLSQDHKSGRKVFIASFDPGTIYERHSHPTGEDLLVLKGEYIDEDRTYGPGSYLHYPVGSIHEPTSPSGCELLVILPGA